MQDQTQSALSKLRESERHFRLLADNAPVMIRRSGADGKFDWFNAGWLGFTGRGMAQELGDGWTKAVHPDDLERCLATYASAFEARQEFRMDYRLRRHDGVWRWIADSGRPYWSETGDFLGYFGSCIDVTERKTAEMQAATAAEEKQALLQELQHRVRNNLQLIVSLLRMQGRKVRDPNVRQLFEESAARVHSVALAQSQLYESEDLAHIEMARYLASLSEALHAMYGRPDIRLDLSAEPVALPIERAIPIGLIVNELLTNALVHGFPADRPGSVAVRMRVDGAAAFEIEIADDGVGLSAPVWPPDGRSLGMQLVGRLTSQAHGEVRLDRTPPGTRFVVRMAR